LNLQATILYVMFRHRLYGHGGKLRLRTLFDWYLLSFLAGTVNAGGYLAAHRFVSHVTGFATLSGIEAASSRWDRAIGLLSVPLYFLLGVMVSAYWVDRRERKGKHPKYALVMALVAGCLLLAAVGGHLNLFGVFGSEPRIGQDYFLLALLCGASGLQNAAISSATGTTVRTTHLTGLTTDLGIGLVRAFSGPSQYVEEMRTARFRLGTICAFLMGSAIGACFYLKFGYLGFLIPASLAAFAVFEALRSTRRLARWKRLPKRPVPR
jgi:uncharacterized membrane protein YoaK (UPF0700 family)